MSVDLNSLRFTQFLARPAGQEKPKSVEESPNFELTACEKKCLSMRVQIAFKMSLSEAQEGVWQELLSLRKDCTNVQINGLRLLIAHLSFDPLSIHQEQIFYVTDDGQAHHGTEWSKQWNDLLLNLHYIIEIDGYTLSDETLSALKNGTNSLSHLLSPVPNEIVRNNGALKNLKKCLDLLRKCIEDPDKLYPLLLAPLGESKSSLFSEEKKTLYRNVLRLSQIALQQFRPQCQELHEGTIKKRIMSYLRMFEEALQAAEGHLPKLLPLQQDMQRGLPDAFGKFARCVNEMTGEHFQTLRNTHLVSLFRKINAARKTDETLDKIANLMDGTFRHAESLLTRFSVPLFDSLAEQTEAASQFIQGLAKRTAIYSSTLTPLDMYWKWWAEPLITAPKSDEKALLALGKSEMLFQTLRSPAANIYARGLEHIPDLMQELRATGSQLYPQAAVELLEKAVKAEALEWLLPWLNGPLLHQNKAKGEEQVLGEFQKLFQHYVSNGIKWGKIVFKDSISLRKLKPKDNRILSLINSDSLNAFCQASLHLKSPQTEELEKLFSPDFPEEIREIILKSLFFYEDLRTLYLRPFLQRGFELSLSATKQKTKKKRVVKPTPLPPAPSSSHTRAHSPQTNSTASIACRSARSPNPRRLRGSSVSAEKLGGAVGRAADGRAALPSRRPLPRSRDCPERKPCLNQR